MRVDGHSSSLRLCDTSDVSAVAQGITQIDTLLGGWEGVTAAYLVAGENPALVETGSFTSAAVVRAALSDLDLGPDDLAWIVLTHVHLDHCGGTGTLAEQFPSATVVVHPRGARHLAQPERLVNGSMAVYGNLFPLIGGLDPTAEERIVTAEDGHRVPIGPGRDLVVLHAPGHAKHHAIVVDEVTGTVMAGDALGVKLPGGGLYPAVPPPEFDLDAAIASLHRIRDLGARRLLLGHFGSPGDPNEALDTAERQQSLAAEAARRGWAEGGTVEAVDRAVRQALPPEVEVGRGRALDRLTEMGWIDNNAGGLAKWAAEMAAGAS
jgi:glyoxylase-like metal-dependent hydrolase (beta-lactamase superfamily II)